LPLSRCRRTERLKRRRDLKYRDEREVFQSYCENNDLFPDEPPAKHHAFMCEALQDVARDEIERLMVLMPPGHGKSVYCSMRFPSWYLGNDPKHHLVHAAYRGGLASLNGRKVARRPTSMRIQMRMATSTRRCARSAKRARHRRRRDPRRSYGSTWTAICPRRRSTGT
jgi:hypothetical protein